MKNSNMIISLFRHMEWADAEIWASIEQLPGAGDDERLIKLLHHLHMVQYAFLRTWTKQERQVITIEQLGGKEGIKTWGREYYKQLHEYLKQFDTLDLEQIISMPWEKMVEEKIGRPITPATLGATMLQVTSHSTYHRGQINARIRELGGEPRIVDFILWQWISEPEAL